MDLDNSPIINLGIFAHANAGKTTLTEQLLYRCGVLKTPGRVDRGDTATYSMSIERRRGISVRAALACFAHDGLRINLIDTPGHVDFAAEVERAMAVLDGAVLVVSAVEGVQPQTRTLIRALLGRRLPTLIFLNKTDRAGANAEQALGQLRAAGLRPVPLAQGDQWLSAEQQAENLAAYDDETLTAALEERVEGPALWQRLAQLCRDGSVQPLFAGSALAGHGVATVLQGIAGLLPAAMAGGEALSAQVFKVSHEKQRLAYVRLFSGNLAVGDTLAGAKVRTLLRAQGTGLAPAQRVCAGDMAALGGFRELRCGDILGSADLVPPAVFKAVPLLSMQAVPAQPQMLHELLLALTELNDEDPHLGLRWDAELKEIHIDLMGPIQAEVLTALLLERYGLQAAFLRPAVLYKEAPLGLGRATASWARCSGVELAIEPAPPGSGLRFVSELAVDWLYERYQRLVERVALATLGGGALRGFPLTDATIRLVGGWCDSVGSEPGHFNIAVPLAAMRALRQAGTRLLEPMLAFTLQGQAHDLGRLTALLVAARAECGVPEFDGNAFTLRGVVPGVTGMHLPVQIAHETSGRGQLSCEPAPYCPAPDTVDAQRRRPPPDPRDEANFLLHMRGATSG